MRLREWKEVQILLQEMTTQPTSEKELRELDAWIAEHVMGMKCISKDGPRPTSGTEDDYFVREWIHASNSLPHYTTSRADAMAVLVKCLEKLAFGIAIQNYPGGVSVSKKIDGGLNALAPTLELAICRFAKALFQTEKNL